MADVARRSVSGLGPAGGRSSRSSRTAGSPSTLDSVKTKHLASEVDINDCNMVTFLQTFDMTQRELVLLEAARKNDYQQVRVLLDAKTDVNIRNNLDRTALHCAAANGHLEAMDLLMAVGADLNAADKYGMTSILWAAWFGHVEAVAMLVKARANYSCVNRQQMTMIHCASVNNQLEILEYIEHSLPEEINVNATDRTEKTALHLAAEKGHDVIVRKLLVDMKCNPTITDKSGRTALHLASMLGHTDVVNTLITSSYVGVDEKDTDGCTALYLASQAGHVGIVQLLVNDNANINKRNKRKTTPLMAASVSGRSEVVEVLLQHPLKINQMDDDGNSALHLAAAKGYSNIVQQLVSAGANVNLANNRQQSALHASTELGHHSVVAMLILAGADLTAKEKTGKTPLALATRSGLVGIVDLIIRAQYLQHIQLTSASGQPGKNITVTDLEPVAEELNDPLEDSEIKSGSDHDLRPAFTMPKILFQPSASGEQEQNIDLIITDPKPVVEEENDPRGFKTSLHEGSASDLRPAFTMPKILFQPSASEERGKNKDLAAGAEEMSDPCGPKGSDHHVRPMFTMPKMLFKTPPAIEEQEKNIVNTELEPVAEEINNLGDLQDREDNNSKKDLSVNDNTSLKRELLHTNNNISEEDNNNFVHTRIQEVDVSINETNSQNNYNNEDTISKQEINVYKQNVKNDANYPTIGEDVHSQHSFYHQHASSDIDDVFYSDTMSHQSLGQFTDSSSLQSFPDDRHDTILHHSTLEINFLKEIMWKLAKKHLKRDEWKKLAAFWNFDIEHIRAIEYQYSGASSYKEHCYRLLTIWLDCVCEACPNDNPLRLLFEALVAVDRRKLAEDIRRKCNKQMQGNPNKSQCALS